MKTANEINSDNFDIQHASRIITTIIQCYGTIAFITDGENNFSIKSVPSVFGTLFF